jgi:hypothetical protein
MRGIHAEFECICKKYKDQIIHPNFSFLMTFERSQQGELIDERPCGLCLLLFTHTFWGFIRVYLLNKMFKCEKRNHDEFECICKKYKDQIIHPNFSFLMTFERSQQGELIDERPCGLCLLLFTHTFRTEG